MGDYPWARPSLVTLASHSLPERTEHPDGVRCDPFLPLRTCLTVVENHSLMYSVSCGAALHQRLSPVCSGGASLFGRHLLGHMLHPSSVAPRS